MEDGLKIKMYSFTLDCPDPNELSDFYSKLLKWERMVFDEDFACVYPPGAKQGSYPCILFQRNPEYKPPVWPEEPGAQQQMAHMDFAVNDLEGSVQYAIQCGATVADKQFSKNWTVMFDPFGHPFCLCQMKSIMESADFKLL